MNKKELKELNFNKLIKIDHPNIEKYSFEDYAKNGFKHPIKGVCTKCEDLKIKVCPSNPNYKLKTMSHGSTSYDILNATGQIGQESSSDWKEGGVLFILANPGPCSKNTYEEVPYNNYKKTPSIQWHFLNQFPYPQRCEYPYHFKGGEYGELFCSILFTFKLRNMYITDLVKCGLNVDGKNEKYNSKINVIKNYDECVENCIEEYLYKEIQFVDPKIIFCLSNDVHDKIKKKQEENKLKNSIEIIPLKHPSRTNWSFTKEKREVIQLYYFDTIFDGLCKSGIISTEEEKKYYREKRKDKIEDPKIKLEEIGQFLKENGFPMNKRGNDINSSPIDKIYFSIRNNESIISFRWENIKNEKFNHEWFNKKNNEISELFPYSKIEPMEKSGRFRLHIPISNNHYKESILEIINKTKEIMGYQIK